MSRLLTSVLPIEITKYGVHKYGTEYSKAPGGRWGHQLCGQVACGGHSMICCAVAEQGYMVSFIFFQDLLFTTRVQSHTFS